MGTAYCTVEVIPNEFVSLELGPDTLTIFGFVPKMLATLDLRLSAADGLPVEPLAEVIWAISDPEIAILIGLSTGATLIGSAEGTATVTASYCGPGSVIILSDSSVIHVVPAVETQAPKFSAKKPGERYLHNHPFGR